MGMQGRAKISDISLKHTVLLEKKYGVILSNQIKSLDWKTREVEYITKITPEKINEVINKINVLLFE